MKFLMVSSFLPSVLNFRGKLLEAIHAKGYEIHICAPDLADFPQELKQLKNMGYQVHAVPMQRTGTNPIQDLKNLIGFGCFDASNSARLCTFLYY